MEITENDELKEINKKYLEEMETNIQKNKALNKIILSIKYFMLFIVVTLILVGISLGGIIISFPFTLLIASLWLITFKLQKILDLRITLTEHHNPEDYKPENQ